ncbi:hypothetical protein BDQ17DRAFT_516147 [Cyathus striatus]|nr:hypothetical protein BDQ17DRAFT_516147 [Cyathus striatus]
MYLVFSPHRSSDFSLALMSEEHPGDRPGRFQALDPKTVSKGNLYDLEGFWRNRGQWLEDMGNIFSSHYQLGWMASWLLDNSKSWTYCEDRAVGQALQFPRNVILSDICQSLEGL